jgi:hypoxanthine phosphoribosyltransferase
VLLVDDVADTGESLEEAVKHLNSLHPAQLKTAVLQYKTCSKFEPDYYAEKIAEWRWIIYPWMLHEDLVLFIEKILKNEPRMDRDRIKAELEKRFELKPRDVELDFALEDMELSGKIVKAGKEWKLKESEHKK